MITFAKYSCLSAAQFLRRYPITSQFLRKMSKTALVLIAEASEEMEFVITTDMLRRAGITVTTAGISGSSAVKCSRDVVITPDTSLQDVINNKDLFDAVLLPGGLTGSVNMAENASVGEILKKHEDAGKLIGTICAASTALLAHGIGKGKQLTSHPSVQDKFDGGPYQYKVERVVRDGNLITSQGPGTCFEFAIALVEYLNGKEAAEDLSARCLLR